MRIKGTSPRLFFLLPILLCLSACGGGGGGGAEGNQPIIELGVYIKASNADIGEFSEFGYSTAISGDGKTLAVGAPQENVASIGINGNQYDNTSNWVGAVYVFVLSPSGWEQQAYIKASNADWQDQFGKDVSLSYDGNTLAVGAFGEDGSDTGVNADQTNNASENSNSGYSYGAAYIFNRIDTEWRQEAYIKRPVSSISNFGSSLNVSADGHCVAISGFRLEGVDVFIKGAGDWEFEETLIPSSAGYQDRFGESIAVNVDCTRIAIGSPGEDSAATGIDGDAFDNSLFNTGAVYIFDKLLGNWEESAYIKARVTDQYDYFGWSLDLSDDGDVLAVGAFSEDSNAEGVGGNENNDLTYNSGAAYIFTYEGSQWIQQAYIKSTNTGQLPEYTVLYDHEFGRSVAISGDGKILLVGSPLEQGGSAGMNQDIRNFGLFDSGAAFTYVYENGLWVEGDYIKANNPDGADRFGSSVSVDYEGKNLLIGAIGEEGGDPGINGDAADNTSYAAGAAYLFSP